MNADSPTTPPADTTPADPATLPPAPDLRPAADAPAVPTAAPLTWPEWFRPFDIALATFAVVLAFLLASFAARNSDLWRHLAAGRLVTHFQYPVGGDPFTYTAADRPWVNANWLGEVLLFVLHSVDSSGAVAVAVKAIAFAAAIGLLFLLKKPGAPLWPWAVVAAAGAVVAGAFTQLRPQVFALPVMAGILAVLYTADWAKGHKWRMPAILGGLTAVWANVDGFAFLSPLMIGLMLAGDWLDAKFLSHTPPPESADDPFRASPPRPALWRALLLCVAAVLLNPTFLGGLVRDPVEAVAQLLPHELDWQAAAELEKDEDLGRFTHSALNAAHTSNPILGANPSGVFTVILWLVGLAAAGATFARGLGHRHGRLSHLLVWLVPTLLAAVVHARFVPFAMLVAVPFIAAHLNGFGRWVPALATLPEQLGRVVLIGCRAGRFACLIGLIGLVVAAVPGWLHPWNGTAAGRRYVDWKISPDDGLTRAGETFARWHADPARAEVLGSVRGLNTHPDLGDYLAYHAPQEKTFITSRYRLHRAELPDVVYVRQRLYPEWKGYLADQNAAVQEAQKQTYTDLAAYERELKRRLAAVKPPVEQGWLVNRLGDRYDIGYVSVAQAEAPTRLQSLYNVRVGFGVSVDDLPQYGPPWHLDGRLLVVGQSRSLTEEEAERYFTRHTLPPAEKAAVELLEDQARKRPRNRAMAWDVPREVFGPRTPPAEPPPMAIGLPPQQGWENDLLLRPPARPVGLDDADAVAGYIDQLIDRRTILDQQAYARWQQRSRGALGEWMQGVDVFGGTTTGTLARAQVNGAPLGPLPAPPAMPKAELPSDVELALPFLAARSARDGLRVDPTSAGGFVALARACSKQTMPATDASPELFPVGALPPLGPNEAELQVLTALRRAVDRLPDTAASDGEHTAEALRARLELTRLYLQVGLPMPVMAYRQVGKTEVQEFRHSIIRVGYVDAARNTLNELIQVADKTPAGKLDDVAGGLLPLWQVAIKLCEADFWIEFRRHLSTGNVPLDWWRKVDRWVEGGRRDLTGLLVETDYLKKDDWTGWQDKFVQDLAANKVDAGVVKDRLQRLHGVLDKLVGRRMGRVPRPNDDPAGAFAGYVQSGLFETALKMVQGESSPNVRATYADKIRLFVWLGRAETAQQEVALKGPEVERMDMPADARALERAKFTMIEFELAKLNGNYAKADTLYTELLTTAMGEPPPLMRATMSGQPPPMPTMTDLIFPDLWRPATYAPLTDAELALLPRLLDLTLPAVSQQVMYTGGGVMVWANLERDQLRRRLLFQALTHYQRGVFAMLGGDPARARAQFDKAADPQGVSRFQTPVPADAPKEAREALPVHRLGPSPQLEFPFEKLLPKYRELLAKHDAK